MRIAILTSNTGVEKSELEVPRTAMMKAGWQVSHLAPEAGAVQTVQDDTDKDVVLVADVVIAEASMSDYDALVIPGGTVNVDRLRTERAAVEFTKAMARARKPIAAICHGPWLLVEAGLAPGKTMTSYLSLRTDIVNAGGTWVDREVHHCSAGQWDLVTSRNPGDLDAFTAAIGEVFGERKKRRATPTA